MGEGPSRLQARGPKGQKLACIGLLDRVGCRGQIGHECGQENPAKAKATSVAVDRFQKRFGPG